MINERLTRPGNKQASIIMQKKARNDTRKKKKNNSLQLQGQIDRHDMNSKLKKAKALGKRKFLHLDNDKRIREKPITEQKQRLQ